MKRRMVDNAFWTGAGKEAPQLRVPHLLAGAQRHVNYGKTEFGAAFNARPASYLDQGHRNGCVREVGTWGGAWPALYRPEPLT